MSIFAQLKNSFSGLFGGSDGPTQIGIYGPPNAGKTTLSNRIVSDWKGEDMGPASHVPHETRRVRKKEDIEIETEAGTAKINVADMPGVQTKVDKTEFTEDFDFEEEDAVRRSREAAQGISDAMRWLREDIDGVLYVVDSAEDPLTQVNTMLIGIIEDEDIPVLVLANKTDLEDSDVEYIRDTFENHMDGDYEVVPVSAKEGENIDKMYEKITENFG